MAKAKGITPSLIKVLLLLFDLKKAENGKL
jgi:hypothetical protein